MKLALAFASLICVGLLAAPEAQQASRRPLSPPGSSSTQIGGDRTDVQLGTIGGRWIEVTYGRPIKRGRDIFGTDDFVEFLNDGAPLWRAGANVSTRLTNEMPLEIGGTRIAPGNYTVFIELARGKWTFILSTYQARNNMPEPNDKDGIFGAYDYSPAKDLARAPMTLETLPHSFDQLHWEFLDITPRGGKLAILWDKQMAWVPFTVVD